MSYKYQGKKFLSLPEQVEVNRREIKRLLDEKFVIFTTTQNIQNITFLTVNELTTVFRQPIVGDLIYGGDFYYAQITRVGENVVEFETIGPIADEDAIRGPKGDKGDTGATGATGPQGPQGIPGEVQLKDLPHINWAIPDLTGKEYLGDGVYRIGYSSGRYDYRYNINTGQWLMDGEYPSLYAGNEIISFELPDGTYTIKITVLSGSSNQVPFIFRARNTNNVWGNFMSLENSQTYTFTGNLVQWRNNLDTGIYDNMTLLLQIEEGSQATPYVVPGQIPQYALQEQEAWITPTLINGWVHGIDPLQYMKDSMGFVHFRGAAKHPTGPSVNMMHLPVGYRPELNIFWSAFYGYNNFMNGYITATTGLIRPVRSLTPDENMSFNFTFKAV